MRYLVIVAASLLAACGTSGDDNSKDGTASNAGVGACDVLESAPGRVVIGFWDTDDCSGDPLTMNSFPIDAAAACYCWPGHSGENSADTFSCNTDEGSFTYTQYGSLDCGNSDDTPTVKTSYTTRCEQDIPPTLYSKIVDFAACE